MRTFLIVLFLAAIFTPVAADAQTSHSASQAAIDDALQRGAASVQADRERALRLLERPEVAAIAKEAGLDLQRAQAAVAAFSDADLASIGSQVVAAEDALVGGQSRITISTTLLIIGLLLLIVLILALK